MLTLHLLTLHALLSGFSFCMLLYVTCMDKKSEAEVAVHNLFTE